MKSILELFLRIFMGIAICATSIAVIHWSSLHGWVPWHSENLKEGVWTTATRESGSYHGKYDVRWVAKLFCGLEIECKLQKSPGSNDYNFISKMKGLLTPPKMSLEEKERVNRYQISVEFKLIDADGFVLLTLDNFSTHQSLTHSNYPVLLEWENNATEREVTAMNIRKQIVPEDVAKKVSRITFKPRLDY